MASKTSICNLALSRIGISRTLADVDNTAERSNEAVQCRLWYDQCREFALRDADWNFARRRAALALSTSLPLSIWAYCYVYPANCAAIRSIIPPGIRWPRKDQKIPFEIANDGTAKAIYTDLVSAEAIWTQNITDATFFDAQFISALAYLIASEIAIPLTVKADMAAQARQGYQFMASHAGVTNAREGETGPEPEIEYQSFRN